MLVLSRKVGEEILIGDSIRIRVSRVRGGHVHLAIAAPKSVPIRRTEICPLIERFECAPLPVDDKRQSLSLPLETTHADADICGSGQPA